MVWLALTDERLGRNGDMKSKGIGRMIMVNWPNTNMNPIKPT
jgi:hypothetical protein